VVYVVLNKHVATGGAAATAASQICSLPQKLCPTQKIVLADNAFAKPSSERWRESAVAERGSRVRETIKSLEWAVRQARLD